MSTGNRRVYQLARLAGRHDSETLALLRAAGVDVRRANDLVPVSKIDLVDKLLGIRRFNVSPQLSDVMPDSVSTADAPPSEASQRDIVSPFVPGVPHRDEIVEAFQIDSLSSSLPPLDAKKSHEPRPRLPKWETVGHPTNNLVFLAADEVEKIHWILVEDFRRSKDPIDPPGIKSRDLLESAIYRLRTSLGGQSKYPTVPMAAAALLHAIISNHAFHNGNKRTALVATLVFLDMNGFLLEGRRERAV
jgi:death-on-curing family protein